MTQSKTDDEITITIALDNDYNSSDNVYISPTYTYNTMIEPSSYIFASGTDTISTGINGISISDINTVTIGADGLTGKYSLSDSIFENHIDIDKINSMCEEYPGLRKVWDKFKTVYDLCKQDYDGKKAAGELDDDIPF